MTVQFVEISGQKMVVLPAADYARLIDLAEDRSDFRAAIDAEVRRQSGEEYLPAEMLDKIIGGESALRVWRLHRKMTLRALSKSVGTSIAQLSDVERGNRRGAPELWRALATALDVELDDIYPL